LNKMTIASKLLTNRRVRRAALELLKDPRADKRALATKLITNRSVREGAVELLKDSSVRTMLLQQATQRFRRP
jgi:predicted site-specific integrase-resolvase